MRTAQEIDDAGTKCGKNLLEVTEDMADASGSAGPGMAWKHQAEVFEIMLDSVCDGLRFYGDRAEAARDLFIASCRIEFYGVHASADKLRKWGREREQASKMVEKFERSAA